MDKNFNIKEDIYKTICPGCNIGCGLYLRKLNYNNLDSSTSKLFLEHRKPDPVNEGKLCHFGVHLCEYYNNCLKENEISDEKINEFIKILNSYSDNEIEFINIGNVTNEEHISFMNLSKLKNKSVNTLTNIIYRKLGSLHCISSNKTNITYKEILNFKKIFIFGDLSLQYPLIVRYLIQAKNNGSEIISFGVKSVPFSSNHIFIDENESLYNIKEFNPDLDTLIISDISVYSNVKRLTEILEFINLKKSKKLFLRPFVNSSGIGYLSKHTNQKSFKEILELINNNTVKVLICLESDIIGLYLDPSIKEIIKKLDHLIVISSFNTETYELATLKISIDPFYMRYGTTINNENRLISQYLLTNTEKKENRLFDLIQTLIQNCGGKKETIDEIEFEVMKKFNIEYNDKIKDPIIKYEKKDYNIKEKISNKIEQPYSLNNECNIKHLYLFSPYYWMSTNKYNDIIEINEKTIQSLNILKGNEIVISCSCGNSDITSKYKISNIIENYIISWNKKVFSKKTFSFVSIKK